ncbi:MAG: tRNA-specific adenosine deaminase [Bacteroidetes bacterium]|nr:MAG: tRNA-specific adenosine deaminase [Bacteroidota bacterium]
MKNLHESYLEQAVSEAALGMRKGDGGPFGALVVIDGKIAGKGHNTVLSDHDPTAHAEVNAIRAACRSTGLHHLEGAVLYTNFEPCPMCLAAMYWAGIQCFYYISDRKTAARAGFMDEHLYSELSRAVEARELQAHRIDVAAMDELLKEWDQKPDKTLY